MAALDPLALAPIPVQSAEFRREASAVEMHKPVAQDLEVPPSAASPRHLPSEQEWESLALRIRNGERDSVEELYRYFYTGVRLFLCRHLGAQELEDKVHDTFVIVLGAIRRNELREPGRLAAFVRTVARRQVANHIGGVVHERRDCVDIDTGSGADSIVDEGQSPEQRVISAEEVAIMKELLDQIDERDRELLVRFYIREHTAEQICEEMNLSPNQFRLLKSRAKFRFGELGRRALARRAFSKFQGQQKFRSIA
ncbi:MAG: sigma-70 family RNA polymerase sigma factor [Bryobacterales bacterium]|nr:sigma-70 family RNA polymerase sigma factor [Bryobacterales bacterium]